MRGKVAWVAVRGSVCATALLAATAVQSQQDALQGTGDVIVTAQRREQRLADVGMSVSSLSGAELAQRRVENIGDLVAQVPGLQATPSPNDTPVYILRGVGFYETSVAAYPDVTAYLDQAPLELPAFTKLTMFDLDRVEVLKGPQGTLFGNNATGGAINFVAAKPRDVFAAGASATYGRFDRAELEGYVTGPLGEGLDGRLAFKAAHVDDWQRSYTRDDTLGATRTLAARLLLDWKPSEKLRFSFDVNGSIDKSDPEAPQLARRVAPTDLQAPIGSTGPTGSVGPDFPILQYPAAPSDPRAADWNSDNRPFADNRLGQAALTGTWDFVDDVRLNQITSYVRYHMLNATEGDGTDLFNLDIVRDRARARSFFQELRLSNIDEHDRLRWVAGVGLDRTEVYEVVDLRFNDASTGAIQGFSSDTYDSDQRMRNEAAFGSLEYDLLPQLTVKAGGRYTWALRRTVNGSFQTPGYVEPFPGSPGLVNLINSLWGEALTPVFCPGKTFVPIPAGGSVSVDPTTCTAGLFRAALHEHNFSWRGGFDFRASRDLLFYANVSKGWKDGSYPTISAPVFDQYQPVTQESLLAYEAGVKASLAQGRASFEATSFYYDYRNKQVRAKTVNPIFGILDQLVNVPKSRIVGAEAQASLLPTRGLDLRLAGTWLDTRVQRYDGIVGDQRINGLLYAVRAPFAGARLPYAPRWQATASADYSHPLSDRLVAFGGVSATVQTKSYASLEKAAQNLSDATLPGHAVIDLRAGVEAGGWRFLLWGKNVGNRFYVTNAVRAYDTIIRYPGRPAEYGITLSRSWD